MKVFGLIGEGYWKLGDLSVEEESGILCVVVKCVDIWRNISGEGGFLVCNWCWGLKVWGVNRIRYFGSLCCKWWVLSVGGFLFFSVVVNVLSILFGEYDCKVEI